VDRPISVQGSTIHRQLLTRFDPVIRAPVDHQQRRARTHGAPLVAEEHHARILVVGLAAGDHLRVG